MKICLATVHADTRFIPLALLYLKAYLVERRNLAAENVPIMEFASGTTPNDIAQQLLQGAPVIVGLSCYAWNVKALMSAAQRIKALQPAVRIVLGGPEVGPVARSVLERHPYIDCIVKSEGERVFADIVATYERGGDIAEVKGICFRNGSLLFETEDAPILHDLNELPSPLGMLVGSPKGRVICIETQRGCVFRCNFCFYNKDLSIRNRRFDLCRVKEEIRFWLQQDIEEIYLMDPVFNLHAARAKEICRFIADHNQRRIEIHTEVWAEFIDDEMARLMHDANFHHLEVGLQTTDANVLAITERRLKLARFIEGIEHLKRYSVPFELQLIYGLPGETRATFRESLNFAASLQPPMLQVFVLMILPGTELSRKTKALRIEFDPEPPYNIRSHYSMSREDVAYGRKVSCALAGDGAWTLRILGREAGVQFADFVDEWIEWADANPAGPSARTDPQDRVTRGEHIRQFIRHYCARKRISPTFYEVSAAIESRSFAEFAAAGL